MQCSRNYDSDRQRNINCILGTFEGILISIADPKAISPDSYYLSARPPHVTHPAGGAANAIAEQLITAANSAAEHGVEA